MLSFNENCFYALKIIIIKEESRIKFPHIISHSKTYISYLLCLNIIQTITNVANYRVFQSFIMGYFHLVGFNNLCFLIRIAKRKNPTIVKKLSFIFLSKNRIFPNFYKKTSFNQNRGVLILTTFIKDI